MSAQAPSDDRVAESSIGGGAHRLPEDMLDLDLDMEADLGIDTVKQAEMFAAIREEWDIPATTTCSCETFRPGAYDPVRL